jgi:prolyl 4-hydroxylase
MAPRLRTILEYVLISIPLYIFILGPLFKTIAPSLFSNTGSVNYQSFEKSESLIIPDEALVCPPHKFNIRILSREPLIVYVDGFLSDTETRHLISEA